MDDEERARILANWEERQRKAAERGIEMPDDRGDEWWEEQPPPKKDRPDLVIAAVVCVAAAVFFGWVGAGGCRSSKPPRAPVERKVGKLEAHAGCRGFVESRLRAPKTADFPTESYNQVVEPFGNGQFLMRSYVDAQNALGVPLRTHFTCVVEDGGRGRARLVSLVFEE